MNLSVLLLPVAGLPALAGIVPLVIGLKRKGSRGPLLAVAVVLMAIGVVGAWVGFDQMIRAREDMADRIGQQWEPYRQAGATRQPSPTP